MSSIGPTPGISSQPPLARLEAPKPALSPADAGELNGRSVSLDGLTDAGLAADALRPPERQPLNARQQGISVAATPPRAHVLAQEALPDRAALIALCGEPKKDITFLGLTVYRMSTGHKDVLAKLDAYTQAVSSTSGDPLANLRNVDKALTALEASLASYQAGSRHSHKAEMGTLLAQVRSEHQTVKAYDKARIPLVAATRVGAFQDRQLQGEMTVLGRGAINVVYKANYLQGTDVFSGVYKRESPEEPLTPQAIAIGISAERPNMACRNVATYRLDQRLGLGVIPRTELALHTNSAGEVEVGCVMGLATGRSHEMDGNIKGIELSAQMAELLSDPDTLQLFLAEGGWSQGSVEGNKLTLVNETRSSRPVYDDNLDQVTVYDAVQGKDVPLTEEVVTPMSARIGADFTDPVLRRETTKLQWLDALSGQVDRHAMNYFIERGPDGAVKRVTGIDNDLAFGASSTDVGQLATTEGHACRLPDVIDADTFNALKGLTPADIDSDCEGLLTADEISATKSRLAGIQAHLAQLEAQPGAVLPSHDLDAWRSPQTAARLGMADDVASGLSNVSVVEGASSLGGAINRAGGEIAKEVQAQKVSYLARDFGMLQVARAVDARLVGMAERPGATRVLELDALQQTTAPRVAV